MSLRNRFSLRPSEAVLGRRRLAKRSHVLMEAMEMRRLLSGYTFTLADQGSSTANGTYLQDLIYGKDTITGDGVSNHTIALGDTLILPDTSVYDVGPDTQFLLPNLGAVAVIPAADVNGSGQLTGTISGTNITFTGGGYTSAPTIVFFGGSGSGAAATATIAGGVVTSINITSGGSGYSSASLPQVAIEGGTGTLTIESSGYAAGSLGSGRVNPATQIGDLARISGGYTDGVVKTELSDAYGHSGAPQNYIFNGIEVCADSATQSLQSAFISVGMGSTLQNYDALVAYNFTFNQDYIHGGAPGETSDDLNTTALQTINDGGMELNANYVTVENSQISDIHSEVNGIETHGIGAFNALGNFTINNNYIEATGEDILFGGDPCYLPSPAEVNNVAITNNFFTKNPAWNPNLPQFAGVAMAAKNDIEFKEGENITVSHNLLQNVWIGADQRGQALEISNIDNGKLNPWQGVSDVTYTDNVIRNVGTVIGIAAGSGYEDYTGGGTGDGGYTILTHDITFSNNLAYNVGGFQWSVTQNWEAIRLDDQSAPEYNITIENNTIIGTDGIAYLEGPGGLTTPVISNLVCDNNVFDESTSGIASSAGTDNGALNSVETAALTVTNFGSGYTSAPTVTITQSGGPTGTNVATATAYIWGTGYPLAGQIMYIALNPDPGTGIPNHPAVYGGSGYNSNPVTVTFTGGLGTGGVAATASATVESDDQIHGYTFTNNVIIGGTNSVLGFPAGNYFPSTEDAAEFLDIPGDEYGLYSGSAYYTDGTGGSIPGVNMATLAAGTNNSTAWTPGDVTNSLQNYYKFDEDTGTTSADNGLGGTLTSTATLSSSTLWTTSGEMNSAIAFSGNGYIKVPNFTADSSFTFAAWIKPNTITSNSYIASTANNAFSLYINNSGQLVAGGATGTVTDTTALPASAWSLVSATYSSGTLTLYVNGAEVGSAAATTTAATTTLYIGASSSAGSSFSGTIDEVRYYSTALSETMSVVGDTNLGFAGGSGYNSGTNGFAVSFTGGGGTGAVATAYAEDGGNGNGEITSIIMTNDGSGYTSTPTMSFSAGDGTGALDTAVMSATPLSYLYQQYGPQFEETYGAGEKDTVTNTASALITAALSLDDSPSAVTQAWSVVNSPSYLPPGDEPKVAGNNWNVQNPDITFYGAGSYLFQCVATDSLGQTATLDFPMTVVSISSTSIVSVSPADPTVAPLGTKTFTVNGTSIANLPVIKDQFGNVMPSSGWSWSVAEAIDGSITSSGGVYTASGTQEKLGSGAIRLNYTTPDGVSYLQASTGVDIVSGNLPGAPASITIAPGTNNSNVISWTAPSGTNATQTGYYVEISPDDNNDYTTIFTETSSTATTYTDTTESTGSLWYYEVQAYNTNGGGGIAGPVGIITGAPAVPTNLVATAGVNSVGLTWTNTAGTNASGVSVWRSIDDNQSDAINIVDLTGNTVSSWTDNTTYDPGNAPTAGTTYYYYVESYNNSGIDSLPSNTSSATPFGPPTVVTATGIASNQASVSWNDPSGGQANFNVQYENANGGSWTSAGSVSAGVTFLVVPGLSTDTQYNFEVQAFTSVGSSVWSTPADARTFNSNPSLVAYEGFNYPVVGASVPLNTENGGLGWSSAWAATSNYFITSTGLTDTNSTVAANLLTTGGGLTADVPNGTLATRTLSSPISNASGTTVWASALVEPTSTVSGYIELAGGANGVYIEFGFTQESGGDFGVEYKDGAYFKNTSLIPATNTTYFLVFELAYGSTDTMTMWVDPNPSLPASQWSTSAGSGYVTGSFPESGTNIIPSISTVNWVGAGYSGAKNNWDELRLGTGTNSSVVTPLAQANAPTNLTATPGANDIALTWIAPSEPNGSSLVQGYDVWRSSNGGVSYGTSAYATLGSSASSYTDTTVSAGTTYYYEVTAENTTGDSINSNVASAIYQTIPAAPSNLAATPGTSSITLTWTDNSSNESAFNIQRSTTGLANSWTIIHSTGANVTTWTDTTPSSGVTYYYQVNASNSAGSSAYDQLPSNCGLQTVIAYEGFTYTTATTWNGNGTTGVGFTGNWSVSNSSSAKIVSGSLNYNSGGNALTAYGNALSLTNNDTATQTLLGSGVGAAGSTLWVSFELNSTGAAPFLKIGNGSTTGNVEFGWAGTGFEAVITTNANQVFSPSAGTATANQTYFIVGEIQYATTSPVINIWIDPTPNSTNGASPAGYTNSDVKTIPSTAGSLSPTTVLSIFDSNAANTGTFDEVRLGSTYASVAPDPILTGSGDNSGTSSKGRTPRNHRATPFLAGVTTPKDSKAIRSAQPAVSTPNRFYPGLDGNTWQWANDTDSVLLGTTSKNGLFN